VDSLFINVTKQLPYPDPQTKHKIPGIIEAVHYDTGGEGIAYHDADNENQGPGSRQDEGVDTEPNDGSENIGWIQPGEWVEYSINVQETGIYNIELRVSSLNGGGQMDILMNSDSRTGKISIPRTGSWKSFTSIFVNDVYLYETDTLMRLQFDIGEFNISRLIFSSNSVDIPSNLQWHQDLTVFPNPAHNSIRILNQNLSFSYEIINILGGTQKTGMLYPKASIDLSDLEAGIYFIKLNNHNKSFTLKFIKR